jgi:putative endonuclease
MAFWAYLLLCSDGSYYAGHTDALESRISQHKAGVMCAYTSARLPVDLVWSETFQTRDQALAAERQIKGWSRAKKQALIAGDFVRIQELARSNRPKDEPAQTSPRT